MSSQVQSKTFIIGDVHGCSEELDDLLKILNPSAQDSLIFIGDLIHKGPDSKGVIERVRSLKAQCLMGNHELRFLKSVRDSSSDNLETHKLKIELGLELNRVVSWMESLPSYIETDNFIAVHAGLIPGLKPQESKIKDLATIRTWDGVGLDLQNPLNPPWFEFYKDSKLVVYGHWARRGLNLQKNVIGLDSGCVYGRQLTALVLPERKIVQVPARKVYAKVKGP